jgi:sulfur carrier protein ThiS
MQNQTIIANAKEVPEHNGEAVAPSEFCRRQLRPGDRLEIVKIVAGG